MSFIAFIGFQAVNSLESLGVSRSAPGWLFASPAGGEMSISVCLLELSSGPASERGGFAVLSSGGGAFLSVGTVSTGACACAKYTRANNRHVITRRINRYFTFIF